MKVEKNKSLRAFNTFGIDAGAKIFTAVRTVEELRKALALNIRPLFVLGGGSNVLLTEDFDGLVIKNDIKGIELWRENEISVYVAAGAGEVWHDLVRWCIERGYGGIENLSLIPGTVGAAPIQNIGAYGVELTEVFHHLEAVDLKTGASKVFYRQDCQFGYRDSIFKQKFKGKYCICKVVLKLSKQARLRLSYGALRTTLDEMGIKKPGIAEVSEAVIRIRTSKLPDPKQLGNAGSFFKNPEIGPQQFQQLQKEFPDLVFYPLPDGKYKIPAGWLIEQCGWKGKRIGNTGCHVRQALVLVNYGEASGREIWELAERIMASVEEKFGIRLAPEVNVW